MSSPRPADSRWVGQFAVILVGFLLSYLPIQLAWPFISLFLRDLSDSDAAAIAWTGAINSMLPLFIGVAAAFWGNLGDRFGLKLNALRALIVAGIVFSLISRAVEPWQVFALTVVYGLTGSPPPAFGVLAAASLPPARASTGMGLLQTVQFVGVSVGPLLGVLSLQFGGFQAAFLISAGLMALTLVFTVLFVRDPRGTRPRGRRNLSMREGLTRVARLPVVWNPMVAMLAFNAALAAANVLVPLYVQRLSGGGTEVNGSVGVVLAITGLGTAIGSLALAWCSSRFGAERVALLSLVMAGLCSLPCIWITDVAHLTAMRFIMGFFCGGVLPALQSVLIRSAARESSVAGHVGTVQGLSQTAMWCGSGLGAAGVAYLASQTELGVMFVVSGGLWLLTAAWWRLTLRRRPSEMAA